MDKNETGIQGTNKKRESLPASGLPDICTESEEVACRPKSDTSALSNQGKKVKSPTKFFSKLTAKSQSFREKPSETPGIVKSMKRLSLKGFIHSKNDCDAGRENDSIPEKTEEPKEGRKPASVMQINQLIEQRKLWEALQCIKNLETEAVTEMDSKANEGDSETYDRKTQDVKMLSESLCNAIQCIVKETLALPHVNEESLKALVIFIQEEEKARMETAKTGDPSEPACLGSARNWRELWKEAVIENVKDRVQKVPIPLKEDNQSWLAVYLGFLKAAVKEDLLKIKHFVQPQYPPDYQVFNTYIEAIHDSLSSCLQKTLKENSLEFNDLHTLLNWVIKTYHSEDFLGHPDLKPEIQIENVPNLLSPEVLDALKNDYIHSIKQKIKSHFDNILKLELDNRWNSEQQLEAEQNSYQSELSLDILTIIREYQKTAGSICESLETAFFEIILKELKEFIPCFGDKFLEHKDRPEFVQLMVTYINNFHDLQRDLQTRCNISCKELEKPLAELMQKHMKCFLDKLRLKTQPMFKEILNRKWFLSNRTGSLLITDILLAIQELSKPLKDLREPVHKDFLNEIHKFVVKEYIVQTLKPKGRMQRMRRMRRSKREEVRYIMNQEATAIQDTMEQMGSDSDWLFPAIQYLGNIIGDKEKCRIRNYITDLSRCYPDIRRKHIVAVLAVRGTRYNKRRSMAADMNSPSEELERNRALFAEINLPDTTQCF